MSVHALLIEDNPADRVLIEELLSQSASTIFKVTGANTLSRAIEILRDRVFDVVLCDLHLPDSSGLSTYSQVAVGVTQTPIIVLSGLDDQDIAIEAVKSGAQDYLVKSDISTDLLSRSIHYAIERKRGELELQRAHDELEKRVEERTAELQRVQAARRQQQEELAHADRLNTLGEMASGLAHELNQPLMAIVGFGSSALQRLEYGVLDEAILKSLLMDMTSEAARAGEIIKRMRQLIQKREPQESMVNLNHVVRDTAELLNREIFSRDVTLELQLPDALPVVLADRVQIQQVLINLMTNALQAMEMIDVADRRLTVATRHEDDQIEIDVSNRGPTLETSELERLFEPFYTTKRAGLGLGLSITRKIIEAHDGRLIVRPDSNSGMTFRFTIPVDRHDE